MGQKLLFCGSSLSNKACVIQIIWLLQYLKLNEMWYQGSFFILIGEKNKDEVGNGME